MRKTVKYRDIVAPGKDDRIIYATEFLSQPDETLIVRKPDITKKSERVIPMADERDIVLINQTIDRDYWSWLRSVGLGTDNIFEFNAPQGIPLPLLIIEFSDRLKKYLSGFNGNFIMAPLYSGDGENRAAEKLGIPLFGCKGDVTLRFYDKGSFKQIAKELGVPIPDGTGLDTGEKPPEITNLIDKYCRETGTAIVKPLTSAAGTLTYSADTQNLEEIVRKIQNKGQFIVEVKHPVEFETNDQWMIDPDGGVHFLGLARQEIVSEAHVGNDHPFDHPALENVLCYSQEVAMFMRDAGYIGVFGLDTLYSDGNFVICENNARMNGSTFARGIIDRISPNTSTHAWKTRALKTSRPVAFNALKNTIQDLLYDGSQREAVFFPYDISPLPDTGEFIGLFAGETTEAVEQLYKEVVSILP